jgi:NAD(P)-dependent dehydrogenase (short-subunit alcohol dehydrogenase family)
MKKNILITGAAGNLGKAAVEKFLAEGNRVIATVSPGKKLDYEVKGDVITYEADLTDEKAVELLITKVINNHQSIDAAVLLVGGFAAGNIEATDGALLKKMYTLNFETAYFVVRPVFQQMKKQKTGGRIMLIGSRPALIAKDGKGLLAYSLSKSLLFKLAEYLNAEGASHNIVTHVVVPSTIDTPINRKAMPDADFSNWVAPEEIASILAFISSDEGKSIREGVVKVYGNA